MNIEEFNEIYNIIKENKDEIFIDVDKKKIIDTYKDKPDDLIKVLKGLKNHIEIKDIKKNYNIKAKSNIINFILNNFQF